MISEDICKAKIDQYGDMIRKICFLNLKNEADCQDVFQNVFFKYATYDSPFESLEHEKAWLIRVTVNECKNTFKNIFKKTVDIDQIRNIQSEENFGNSDLMTEVLKLPKNYKLAIYLHYYEGYTADQIGKILNRKVNSIYSDLKRGREMLKKQLGDDFYE